MDLAVKTTKVKEYKSFRSLLDFTLRRVCMCNLHNTNNYNSTVAMGTQMGHKTINTTYHPSALLTMIHCAL